MNKVTAYRAEGLRVKPGTPQINVAQFEHCHDCEGKKQAIECPTCQGFAWGVYSHNCSQQMHAFIENVRHELWAKWVADGRPEFANFDDRKVYADAFIRLSIAGLKPIVGMD